MISMKTRKRGFTLVEIMVVVIVLAILAAAVLPSILGQGRDNEARVAVARSDIASIKTMLDNFRLDMRRYPTEDEAFSVLREPPQDMGDSGGTWKGPYTEKPIGKDPWGHEYMYSSPAPNGINPFGIMSYGADGQPGGTGFNTDICSWENYDPNAGSQANQ